MEELKNMLIAFSVTNSISYTKMRSVFEDIFYSELYNEPFKPSDEESMLIGSKIAELRSKGYKTQALYLGICSLITSYEQEPKLERKVRKDGKSS